MPQDYLIVSSPRRGRRLPRSSGGGDRDDRGWTLLHVGANKGDLKEAVDDVPSTTRANLKAYSLVKRLLDEGVDVNVAASGPKGQGATPLHLAAKGGHLKVMDELLERGANIDARTRGACGWTPLHNAAKERKNKAMKYLIENGAFMPDNMNDTRFNPPVHYCSGLEWAYEEMRRIQQESSNSNSSSGEASCTSDS